jgi:hypothetical protein
MSQLGLGAMIHMLSGGSKNDPAKYVGNTIVAASMKDERLRLDFENGKAIEIWDDGQSCCEYRHMTTDDDIQSLVGHKLLRIEAKDGPEVDKEYEVHETCFVEVGTDAGFITVTNHNEHNGYYGGFGLTITECS